jgi:hypothetical protein
MSHRKVGFEIVDSWNEDPRVGCSLLVNSEVASAVSSSALQLTLVGGSVGAEPMSSEILVLSSKEVGGAAHNASPFDLHRSTLSEDDLWFDGSYGELRSAPLLSSSLLSAPITRQRYFLDDVKHNSPCKGRQRCK